MDLDIWKILSYISSFPVLIASIMYTGGNTVELNIVTITDAQQIE